MKDYYTLMELMVTLKKQNFVIMDQLDILNVFLKYNDAQNSLNYGLDYKIDDECIVIKHILKDDSDLGFFDRLSFIAKKNESKIIKEEEDYILEKDNIAIINPSHQEHFNHGIEQILNNLFLKNFFLEKNFVHQDKKYLLKISPIGLHLERFDEHDKIDYQLSFFAKESIISFPNFKYKEEFSSIANIKFPKEMFSSIMINLFDATLAQCSKSELSIDSLDFSDDLTLVLSNRHRNNFTRR